MGQVKGNNWRGVTLLNVASTVFSRCIFIRIQDPLEKVLMENQAGFRKGRSCMDMVFIMRRLIEESAEYQKALFINFVDFEKAFDSVFREALWNVLKEYGIPEKLIFMIKALCNGFECAVIHDGNLSAYFAVETGVKQGCILSGLLFLLVIDWLLKRTSENRETGIQWVNDDFLEDCDYADDLGLVSKNFEDTQEKITRLARKAKRLVLKISTKKTETMRINAWDRRKVSLERTELNDTEKFTFLGSILTVKGSTEEDVANRINKVRNSFVSMSTMWTVEVQYLQTRNKDQTLQLHR